MAIGKDLIKKELQNKKHLAFLFDDLNADFLHDTVEIAYLIANGEDLIRISLNKLESELLSEISIGLNDDLAAMVLSESMTYKAALVAQTDLDKKNALNYFNNWQTRLNEKTEIARTAPNKTTPIPTSNAIKNNASKALNKVLAKTEVKMGFTLLNSQEVKVYFGALDGESFSTDANLGVPFKDIINPNHGEFTHRIQWYIAAHCGIPLKTSLPHMVKLYKFITSLKNLWVYVFDRGDMTAKIAPADSPYDFRRPEFFHPWLCDDAQAAHYPLLNGFLKARTQKREATADPYAWLATRLFGRKVTNMNQLSLEDLITVRDYSNSAGGIYRRDIVPQPLKNPLKPI
jgi:hypothetical protein